MRHELLIRSIRSRPNPPVDDPPAEAFLLANKACSPPCFLDFALFLLLAFAEEEAGLTASLVANTCDSLLAAEAPEFVFRGTLFPIRCEAGLIEGSSLCRVIREHISQVYKTVLTGLLCFEVFVAIVVVRDDFCAACFPSSNDAVQPTIMMFPHALQLVLQWLFEDSRLFSYVRAADCDIRYADVLGEVVASSSAASLR